MYKSLLFPPMLAITIRIWTIIVMDESESRNVDRLIYTTGVEEEVRILEQRNLFFKAVTDDIGFAVVPMENNPFIQIETRGMGFEEANNLRPSDDRLHQLIVFDELLAIVMDRRNIGNKHEVTFWRLEPSEQCTAKIEFAVESRKQAK